MSENRPYSSELREQAKTETRESILAAMVQVILKEGIASFTMQNVAKAAGVSLRTVYRHFDSREALLEGLQDSMIARQKGLGLHPPMKVENFVAAIGPLFEDFYREKDAMRASIISATALGYQTRLQRESFSMLESALREHFTLLPAAEVREAAAALRAIISRYYWHVLAVDLELSPEEGGRAVTMAVRAIVTDLEAREALLRESCAKTARKSSKQSGRKSRGRS